MSAETTILLVMFVGLMLLNVPIALCIGLASVATIGYGGALGLEDVRRHDGGLGAQAGTHR